MLTESYDVVRGIANQWEVWMYIEGHKREFIKVFDIKYQADRLARKLNKEFYLENRDKIIRGEI